MTGLIGGQGTTLKIDGAQGACRPLADCGITAVNEAAGTRFVLPKRDLGKARTAGIAFVVMGLACTIFMIFWMSGPIIEGSNEKGIARIFSIGFGLMGIPGLLFGLAFTGLGIAILRNIGHSEVLVTRDSIRSIECIGPLKLRFKRNLSDIEKLVVSPVRFTGQKDAGPGVPLGLDLCALRVDGASRTPLLIAPGYPKDVIRTLAENIRTSVESAGARSGLFAAAENTIQIVEEDAGGLVGDPPVSKPAGCNVTCHETENSFALMVPPRGLWKGSGGLFGFSLVWNVFMAVFTFALVFAGSSGDTPIPVYLFIAGFWAVGIGLLLGAINMGKRQTMVAIAGDILGIKTRTPFKTKEIKTRLDEIGAICMGPSGVEVNEKPLMELQVLGKDGKKKAGVLKELKQDELLWMAWLLRSKTGIPRNAGGLR